MTDDEIDAALTEVSGIGPCTAHGFLIFAPDRPDVLLSGALAERSRQYGSLAVSYLFASEFEEGA
jgi:hypothetical protein